MNDERIVLSVRKEDWEDAGFSVETIKLCGSVGLCKGLGDSEKVVEDKQPAKDIKMTERN